MRKKFLMLLTAISLGICNSTIMARTVLASDYFCSHGYQTMNDCYLVSTTGKQHGGRKFWISSNFSDTQKGMISNGILQWNSVTDYLQMKSEGTEADARIRVKRKTLGVNINGFAINGRTRFGINSATNLIDEYPEKNYQYAVIELDTANTGSSTLLKKVATHEAGHALGLTHVTTAKSVMYPNSNSDSFAENLQRTDRINAYHVYC